MKAWEKQYFKKLKNSIEALHYVKSGYRVVVGHACGEPSILIDALITRASELKNVEIVHMVPMGNSQYVQVGMQKSFHHNSLFVGKSTREAVFDGRASHTPCFFSEVPRLFKERILPVDVTLLQVTPPNKEGYCSFGVSVDYTFAASIYDRWTIAQINKYMPRTMGAKIHINDIDCIVEHDEPLIELKQPQITHVEKTIGEYIADLIEDGSTLQLGIGAIPDAVLLSLKEKKDLGIHSEMFSDGVVNLTEIGVITNKKKTINKNKFVATFLMGTQKLYNFINNNPDIFMQPVDYTNDPYIIGKHDNMISINSALQIDLMGQVNAEMIGRTQFSGVGGQIDFIRGASKSKGGKSIIAFPSTALEGKISRIKSELDQGSSVTTSRNDIHYIITEYGVANLRGKNTSDRAKMLINIAHPSFRDELLSQAKKNRLI